MAGAARGMIFLDPHNKIITEYFQKKLEDPRTKEVVDQRFSEFDGTRLRFGLRCCSGVLAQPPPCWFVPLHRRVMFAKH